MTHQHTAAKNHFP